VAQGRHAAISVSTSPFRCKADATNLRTARARWTPVRVKKTRPTTIQSSDRPFRRRVQHLDHVGCRPRRAEQIALRPTSNLMHSAVAGQIPQRMRQFLIVVGELMLADAGQAASAPSTVSTISAVLAGLAALCLGAAMAFCGAYFALRKN